MGLLLNIRYQYWIVLLRVLPVGPFAEIHLDAAYVGLFVVVVVFFVVFEIFFAFVCAVVL